MCGLKYIREKYGMSLTELALKLGVSRQVVSRWEIGYQNIPPKRLNQLSQMFGISENLFGEIAEDDINEINSDDSKEEYEIKSMLKEYNNSNNQKDNVLKKVEKVISGTEDGDVVSLLDEIGHVNRYAKLFERFCDIAQHHQDIGDLFLIIHALEITFNINEELYVPWGSSLRCEGLISNDEEAVQALVAVIKKYLK